MCYALPVNTFWVIDLFYLVLKISNGFYIAHPSWKTLESDHFFLMWQAPFHRFWVIPFPCSKGSQAFSHQTESSHTNEHSKRQSNSSLV